MAATLSKRLTIKDLAVKYEMSEDATRKWLHRLEARHPGTIKRRSNGPKGHLYVTLASLRRADPDWIEREATAQEELLELKKKTAAMQTELNAMKKRLREFGALLEKLASDKIAALQNRALNPTV